MLGDLRDWLAGFDAPREARPLGPETETVNRRQLRRGWVDVSYRSEMGATDALAALAGRDVPLWMRNGLGELRGSDGRFMLRLAETNRPLPLGLNAVGRVRPDDHGSMIEVQMGRTGGDLPIFVVAFLAAIAALMTGLGVLGGDGIPWGVVVMVPLAAASFVGVRLFGSDGADAVRVLYRRVPPMLIQPQPLPVCSPDRSGEPGQVRRALVAALSRPERVRVATTLSPVEVRDALRARIRESRRRRVAAPWDGTALKGRATPRTIDLYIPGGGGGEELTSPRVSGTIVGTADGSILRLRVGRSPGAAWGLLVLAAAAGIGIVGCLAAAVVQRESGPVGTALLLGLFGGCFAATVVATGWSEDEGPDPVAAVVDVVAGTVVAAPAPAPGRARRGRSAPPPPPPPPLVSPYRR